MTRLLDNLLGFILALIAILFLLGASLFSGGIREFLRWEGTRGDW